MSSVTKLAFARGVGNYLQRTGTTQIPTEGLLKQACAIAANSLDIEPAANAVPYEETFKVAKHLVAFNEALSQQGKVASAGQGAIIDHDPQVAYGDMITHLVKQAMHQGSSVIDGKSSPPNTTANSMDANKVLDEHRGEGTNDPYLKGLGGTNIDGLVPANAVQGAEMKHPLAPKAPGGVDSNSVTRASQNSSANSKEASVQAALRKLAMGDQPKDSAPADSESSTITGASSAPNTQHASPSGEGKLDIAQRPEDYAVVGQGGANFDGTPSNAVTGMETPHPDQPAHSGDASNSVVDATKNAQWNQHFNAVATLVGPQLPDAMPMEEKVAAVKQCMGLEPIAQQQYLQKVAQQYSPQSTVGSLLGSLNQLTR